MTIQEWGAIGEIIGGIAVVASLVYLAIQIRQNTRQLSESMKAMELAAFERNVSSGNRVREMFILNKDITELYQQGLKDYAALSDQEKIRFDLILSNMFSEFQGAYIRQLTYRHDPADFEGSMRMLERLLVQPAIRAWIRRAKPDWRPEFSTMVAERVQRFAAKGD